MAFEYQGKKYKDPNAAILSAKQDYSVHGKTDFNQGLAALARSQGGTIGADVSLGDAVKMYSGSSMRDRNDRGDRATYRLPSFQPRQYNAMDYNAALTQSRAAVDPLRIQERESAGRISQQQQSLLRQNMSARGQLGGGLQNELGTGISSDLMRQLAAINQYYNAQAAGQAQNIVDRSQDRADRMAQQDFQQYAALAGLGMQQFGLNQDVYRDERNFGYQQGRDEKADQLTLLAQALQQEQWQASPQAQDWYLPAMEREMSLGNQLTQAQIGAANRSNIPGPPKPLNPLDQLRNKVLAGQTLTADEKALLGIDNAPDESKMWSEYRALLNLKGDPFKWKNLSETERENVENRLEEIYGSLYGNNDLSEFME